MDSIPPIMFMDSISYLYPQTLSPHYIHTQSLTLYSWTPSSTLSSWTSSPSSIMSIDNYYLVCKFTLTDTSYVRDELCFADIPSKGGQPGQVQVERGASAARLALGWVYLWTQLQTIFKTLTKKSFNENIIIFY